MHRRLLLLLPLLLVLLLLAATPALASTTYQVQPGDTLYLIGQRFGVTATAIQQANGLTDTRLFPGQVLTIPSGGNGFAYTVQPGDTLFKLAQRFGTTAAAIRSASGLASDTIYPGQRLWIPSAGTATYTVQPGDTLFTIGQRFGVPYEELMRANGLGSTSIVPGQVLRIPQGSSGSVSRGGVSEADLALLARLVYAEARGEPYAGQVGVAAVVINRVESPDFPDTIPAVIYQPGAFTALQDGQFYNLVPNATARKAAQDAVNGWDPTGGALYYWNPAVATNKWVWSRQVVARIGNHVFAI